MGDMFDLTGRVAVVTGGAGVLGGVFASALAEKGAHIVLADLDQGLCDEVAAKIASNYGVTAVGVQTDVGQSEDVENLVGRTMADFGRVNILINNAAAQPPGFLEKFEDYDLDVWNAVMNVNVTGMFLMAKSFGPHLRLQKGASIINISSIYGVVAPDQRIYHGSDIVTPAVYSVSKAGVLGLTRYLSTYWGELGIRVNALTPGGVFRDHHDPFLTRYSARVPMGRMADKSELCGAVVYLASDASSYVTGQNIIVDGGLTVW